MSAPLTRPRSPELLAAENVVLRALLALTRRYALETSAALVAFSAELRPAAAGLPAAVQARLAAILYGYAAITNLHTLEFTPFNEALNKLDLAAAGAPVNKLRL